MGVVIKGEIPEGFDELGLTRLARLALAVGTGSVFSNILEQIGQYSETAVVSQDYAGDVDLHRLDFLVNLIERDLSHTTTDGIELEEEVRFLFDRLGLDYEITEQD